MQIDTSKMMPYNVPVAVYEPPELDPLEPEIQPQKERSKNNITNNH